MLGGEIIIDSLLILTTEQTTERSTNCVNMDRRPAPLFAAGRVWTREPRGIENVILAARDRNKIN